MTYKKPIGLFGLGSREPLQPSCCYGPRLVTETPHRNIFEAGEVSQVRDVGGASANLPRKKTSGASDWQVPPAASSTLGPWR